MDCKDREGNVISNNDSQDKLLKKLYETEPGRKALRLLVSPAVSKLGGKILDSRASAYFVPAFAGKNHISMEEYEETVYESYNQFFTRRIKAGERTFAKDPQKLCAPCDSKLSVYRITKEGTFAIKNTIYTMDSLVRSKKLAQKFEEGILCVFRLTVDDYHHYCYVDSGKKTRNYHIPGVFHTVNPLANDQYPIYTENTREFSILRSANFGKILMMEVGALLVGRIVNHHEEILTERGMEKGFFEFGGSTVVLAFQKDAVLLDEVFWDNTKDGFETIVKMGEVIGQKGIRS